MALPWLLSAKDNSPPVEVHRDLEYARPGGLPLKLDLYLPQGVAKPIPVVLWVHGGGWRQGSKEIPVNLPLASAGFAVASIDYRLSQQAIFPAQINDCKAAVRWLRVHAAEYGLDPNRIGAVGASAGGHLVALLGTTAHHPELEGDEGNPGVSSAVQAVCDFFGPTNLTDFVPDDTSTQPNMITYLIGGPIIKNWEKARAASPVFYVDKNAAPFFIAHGSADPIVPPQQSVELDSALKKAGVPSTLCIVKDAGHGFHDPVTFAAGIAFLQHYLMSPAR